MKLAFRTFASPGWDWREALSRAVRLGFEGVEWKVVDGQPIGPDFPLALAEEIGASTADNGLGVPALHTEVRLALPATEEWERASGAVRRLLAVAKALGAEHLTVVPWVRRDPRDAIPPGERAAWLKEMLLTLPDEITDSGVRLALTLRTGRVGHERSAGPTCSALLNRVLWDVRIPGVGVQWDLTATHLAGEPVEHTWDNIRPWLAYLQVGDAVAVDGGWRSTSLGEGRVPVRQAAAYVGGARFHGWASYQIDTLGYPEQIDPEELLLACVTYLRDYRSLT